MNANPHERTLAGCCRLDVPQVDSSLWLAWTSKGLRHCEWSSLLADRPANWAPCELQSLPSRLLLLESYLEGNAVDPVELPVDLVGTAFQLRVWEALRRVPRGHVRTYGGIAKDIGSPRAMRAVGAANGRNPVTIVVPCHRIVASGNELGGYSGGLHRKRFLLELEGVALLEDHVAPGQTRLL